MKTNIKNNITSPLQQLSVLFILYFTHWPVRVLYLWMGFMCVLLLPSLFQPTCQPINNRQTYASCTYSNALLQSQRAAEEDIRSGWKPSPPLSKQKHVCRWTHLWEHILHYGCCEVLRAVKNKITNQEILNSFFWPFMVLLGSLQRR